MRLRCFFVFLLLLGFSSPTAALPRKDTCPNQLATSSSPVSRLFTKAFSDPKIYQNAECADNVARFLGLLARHHVSIEDSQVWYLTGPAGMVVLHPRNPFAEWGFHVILVHQGTVYDFDFKTDPTPMAIKEYVSQNITVGESRILERVSVLALPAEVFRKHFPKNDSHEEMKRFARFLEKEYEFQPLQQKLKQITP